MTPAEQARQIDREEFAAECAAARQRALVYAHERRIQARQQVQQWIGVETARPTIRPQPRSGRTATLHSYNGEALTIEQWANRLGITTPTLFQRRRKLGSLALAIALGGSQKLRRKPGVVSDLPAFQGTGAGSTAQENPNITFSGIEA